MVQTPVVQESTVLIKGLLRSSFLFQFKTHNAFSCRIVVVVGSPKTPLTQITMESSEYNVVP